MIWPTLALYARKALAWVTASSTRILVAALALTSLYGVYQRGQATKWHGIASERLTALNAVSIAQKAALEAQQALNAATVAKYAQHAKEADNAKDHALADASARYAAANRLRAACDNRSTSQALASAEAGTAGRDTGPGDTSIVVSAADFATLNDNTARLLKVKSWGDGLVRDGLGVP